MTPATTRHTGAACFVIGVALLVVRLVTVRWVPRPYSDGGAPIYGFPMPAFGWGGASSGEWVVAVVPVVVDVAVAMVAVLPIAYVLARRSSPRVMLGVGLVAATAAAAVHAESAVKLAMGLNHARLTMRPFAEGEPPCCSGWIGEPRPTLDWEDPDDPCVRQARAELDGR